MEPADQGQNRQLLPSIPQFLQPLQPQQLQNAELQNNQHDLSDKPGNAASNSLPNNAGKDRLFPEGVPIRIPHDMLARMASKLDVVQFGRFEGVCRETSLICSSDRNWRRLSARAIIFENMVLNVMKNPANELKPLVELTAAYISIKAPYIAICGEITDARLIDMVKQIKANNSSIDRIIVNPDGIGSGSTSLNVKLESLIELSDTAGCEGLVIHNNVTAKIDQLLDHRMTNNFNSLTCGTSLPVTQQQFECQMFKTFIGFHININLDPCCIIPFVKKWIKNEQVVRFIQIKPSAPGANNIERHSIDTTTAISILSSDIRIRGGPLWQTYYNGEIGKHFPPKWSSPSTAHCAWAFIKEEGVVEDIDQNILLLFWYDDMICLGTVNGFMENAHHLHYDILDGSTIHDDMENYQRDLISRQNRQSNRRLLNGNARQRGGRRYQRRLVNAMLQNNRIAGAINNLLDGNGPAADNAQPPPGGAVPNDVNQLMDIARAQILANGFIPNNVAPPPPPQPLFMDLN